jgi:hypothetical protein
MTMITISHVDNITKHMSHVAAPSLPAAMHRSAAATYAASNCMVMKIVILAGHMNKGPVPLIMLAAAASPVIAAMHRSAAATYAASNVRINCVAAGLVEAPASSEFSKDPELGKASAEVRGLIHSRHTLC